MSLFDEIKVFSGNSHPELARDICKYLKIPLGKSEVFKFSNDETFEIDLSSHGSTVCISQFGSSF